MSDFQMDEKQNKICRKQLKKKTTRQKIPPLFFQKSNNKRLLVKKLERMGYRMLRQLNLILSTFFCLFVKMKMIFQL